MSSQSLNWNDLKVFLCVARDGSLAKAASRLGVTHSTVFRRLSELEGKLSTRLFTRGRDGYQLTEIGIRILRNVVCVSNEIEALSQLIVSNTAEVAGTIRLSAPHSLICNSLPQHILKFGKSYPTAEVHLLAGDHDLGRDEADIAIKITDSPHDTLIAHRLYSLEWGAFASKEYIEIFGAPKNANELRDHSIISASPGIAQIDVYKWFEKSINKKRIVCRANDFVSISGLVSAGLGVGLLPDDHANSELVRLFTFPSSSVHNVWLLIHPDARSNHRVKVFRDFLIASLNGTSRNHFFAQRCTNDYPAAEQATASTACMNDFSFLDIFDLLHSGEIKPHS